MSAKKTKSIQPDLFSFLNYREYLATLTQHLKTSSGFTVRQFAKDADIKAPGYLKMVIDGKRNLTEETTLKFCRALGLNGKEKLYFLNLVLYNQSEDPNEKKELFSTLMRLLPRSEEFLEEKRYSRYFSKDYYVTIREMVVLRDFKEDHKWIAKRCFPQIKPAEAKKAIQTLIDLGLLNRDTSGKLVQVDNFLQTQDRNTQAAAAYHFHEAILDKSRYALTNLPQIERNFYALTLPMPAKLFPEIIDEFYILRDKIVAKIESSTENYDDVYQINFQLFPVTRKKGVKK